MQSRGQRRPGVGDTHELLSRARPTTPFCGPVHFSSRPGGKVKGRLPGRRLLYAIDRRVTGAPTLRRSPALRRCRPSLPAVVFPPKP